jgi:uncharacterized membrane protein YfcA
MEIFLFVITITLACLLQAIVGFGSALVATPLAPFYLGNETVVSSMLVVGVAPRGPLADTIQEAVHTLG